MKKSVACLLASLMGDVLSQGQGSFQNLDFESAQLIYVDPPVNRVIPTTDALPGWTAISNMVQLSAIPYGPAGVVYPVSLYSQTNGGSVSGFFSVRLCENSLMH